MDLGRGTGNGQKHQTRHSSSLTPLNGSLGEESKPNSTADKERIFSFPEERF